RSPSWHEADRRGHDFPFSNLGEKFQPDRILKAGNVVYNNRERAPTTDHTPLVVALQEGLPGRCYGKCVVRRRPCYGKPVDRDPFGHEEIADRGKRRTGVVGPVPRNTDHLTAAAKAPVVKLFPGKEKAR